MGLTKTRRADGPDDGSDGMACDGPPAHARLWRASGPSAKTGQDDGPPDFILHVLSRGVINVHYCTYCSSEQTQGQPMATATRFSYYFVCLHMCVCL